MILLKPALIGQSKMLNINTKGETLNIHIKYQSELRKHKLPEQTRPSMYAILPPNRPLP